MSVVCASGKWRFGAGIVRRFLAPDRNGHDDFGQVVGGAELQRFAARQSVSWLVAHDVVDNVGGARAPTLNQGFEFGDSLFSTRRLRA